MRIMLAALVAIVATAAVPVHAQTAAVYSNSAAASRSQSSATGAVAGSQVNAPISSQSQGGNASASSSGGAANVTVVNRVSSGARGGWRGQSGASAGSAATQPAPTDPSNQLGSPNIPLTENLNTSGTTTLRNVPEIVAPNISGGNPCLVGVSGGGAGPGIGVTIGFGYSDHGCERRNDAAVLHNLGLNDAAVELMCQDQNVRAALLRSGHPCAEDRVAATPVAQVDPAVIRRQQAVATVPASEVQIRPSPPPPDNRPAWCWGGNRPRGVSFADFNNICGH